MKKMIVLFLSIVLMACTNEVTFPEGDEPFLEYEYGSYGPDLIYNLYPVKIALYSDGQGTVSTPIDEKLGIDRQAPYAASFRIDTEAIEHLQSKIVESNFFALPEDLSDRDTMDGGYQYLTIYTEVETKTVGGRNPHNESLDQLTEEIMRMLPEDVIPSFRANIADYQKEQRLRE